MKRRVVVSLLLFALTALTFARVVQYGFMPGFDDQIYILENQWVLQGLTPASISWVFTNTAASYWQPITWLSHMIDVELYGLNPAGHHLSSIALHATAAVVLFLVLQAMTGALGRSALVAALFAVHPLHVESVAWVSERKDVLCALFWFLGMGAYLRYVRSPGLSRLVVVFAAFAAALMAKPMAVTFPFVLLLLDVWPLGRLRLAASTGAAGSRSQVEMRQVWLEKLPMFLLLPVFMVVSYRAQVSYSDISNVWTNAPWIRVCNAIISYGDYLVKTVIPTGLAIYYPHPGSSVSILKTAVSGVALLLVTALCVRVIRSLPSAAVGWFWYLGTLVPVIGFIEYGQFARADRNTYLPLVGIFMAVAWGCGELCKRLQSGAVYRPAAAAAVVLAYAAAAWVQTGYWRDEVTLWTRTVQVTGDNIHARIHLGSAWRLRGEPGRAEEHYREAIRLNGNITPVRYLLADVLEEMGRGDEAAAERRRARELDLAFKAALEVPVAGSGGQGQPRFSAQDHNNAGVGAALINRPEEAEAHFRKALELAPDYAGAHYNLANLYRDRGRLDEAYAEYLLALRYDPGLEAARSNLKALEGRRR